MFSEESDHDEFWGFESVLLILCILYVGSTPGNLVVLEIGASYTRVYMVDICFVKSSVTLCI